MQLAFWACVAVIVYTYLGYLAVLYLVSRITRSPVHRADAYAPTLSIVMAMRNEARNVGRKLESIAALDYPHQNVEIIVVSDGSTDGTNEILTAHKGIRSVILADPAGKAGALNRALAEVKNEIVVFTDARQELEPQSLMLLVSNFADPSVGCVSGELMLRSADGSNVESLGLYWKIEKKIRSLESHTGSVVGATGSYYAVRRELIPTLPAGLLLDDVYVPMHVVKSGYRVVFEPQAKAWDVPVADAAIE